MSTATSVEKRGKENNISCSCLAVRQDKILLCQTVKSDLEHVNMFCIKQKEKKTQCRNELTKLKYLVVKGIIAKFLLHLDAFKFLRPALTIRDFFFVLNKFCHG